jgi:hypothetical protein
MNLDIEVISKMPDRELDELLTKLQMFEEWVRAIKRK